MKKLKKNNIKNKHKNLISLMDLSREEFLGIFKKTGVLKNAARRGKTYNPVLRGKTLGMIFEKPSTRTSISFAVGMYQLGGLPLILSAQDLQLYRGESISDTARVLSRYVDIIMIRAHSHTSLIDMAARADVPVINGLTDREHPCQILADLFTIIEKKQTLKDVKIVYVGDGNNIANSWIIATAVLGFNLTIACPEGYDPDPAIWEWGRAESKRTGAVITLERDPHRAVSGADVVYTDVWTSMGREKEKEIRTNVFKPYQVNRELVSKAKKNAIVMHCLPAHRGQEITDEVIDGKQSVVFDEAENRLHVQKAVILKLIGGK